MTCLDRVRAHGIAVTLRSLPSGMSGFANPAGITLDPEGDSRNRLFVLLHELAHMLGHVAPLSDLIRSMGGDADAVTARKREAEFEAEAAAFTVAAILGLEHPGARDYLLHYQASPDVLSRHLGAIQRLVQQMLRVLGIVEGPMRPFMAQGATHRRPA